MNKSLYIILLAGIVLCGCDINNQQEAVYWDIKKTIKYWDGKSVEQFEGKAMESMLWLRPKFNSQKGDFPTQHQIYKRFDDSDYMILLECLVNPEKPSVVTGVSWSEFLYISFLDGTNYVIGFSIRSKTIILPNGYSERLYSLLTEKEASSAYDANKDSGLIVFPGVKAPTPEHRYRDDWIDQSAGQKTE
jgi:hypothetical protein